MSSLMTMSIVPERPNGIFTYLQYFVTNSLSSSLPQYKYVMDLRLSGSDEILTRDTQPPNLNNSAVFVPSKTMQGYAVYDDVWKITGSFADTSNTGSYRVYDVEFGEQYGTSPSSSIEVTPNIRFDRIAVIPAVANLNGTSYDVDIPKESGNNILSDALDEITIGTTDYLDEWEDKTYLTLKDYHTISSINPGPSYTIRVYDGSGGLVLTQETVTIPSASYGGLYHLPIGPKNLLDRGGNISSSIAYYDSCFVQMEVNGQTWQYRIAPNYQNSTGHDTTSNPVICNTDDYTRFAFINRYGVYDYYNCFNPVQKSTDIIKEQLTENRLNMWTGGQNPFQTGPTETEIINDMESRGKLDYYKKLNDLYVIETDMLNENTALWLKHIFISPRVYIQEGNDFVPIIITNNDYIANSNMFAQKQFRYRIQFRYANPRRSRIHVGRLEGGSDF